MVGGRQCGRSEMCGSELRERKNFIAMEEKESFPHREKRERERG